MRFPTIGCWRASPSGFLRRMLGGTWLALILAMVLTASDRPVLQSMLTLYQSVLTAWAGPFTLQALTFEHSTNESAFQGTFSVSKSIRTINGDRVPIDPRGHAQVRVNAQKALQPLVVMVALLIMLPAVTWREWTTRWLLGLPLAFFAIVIDVPVVMVGELWNIICSHSNDVSLALPSVWGSVMDAGGRVVVGCLAAIMSTAAAAWLELGWD